MLGHVRRIGGPCGTLTVELGEEGTSLPFGLSGLEFLRAQLPVFGNFLSAETKRTHSTVCFWNILILVLCNTGSACASSSPCVQGVMKVIVYISMYIHTCAHSQCTFGCVNIYARK